VQPSDGVTSRDNGAARKVGPGRLRTHTLPGGERVLPLKQDFPIDFVQRGSSGQPYRAEPRSCRSGSHCRLCFAVEGR
jgi:hypothetical protein